MKNKKIKLLIGGTGHEITRSKFTSEEIEKIKTYCDENDEDIENEQMVDVASSLPAGVLERLEQYATRTKQDLTQVVEDFLQQIAK